MKKIINYLENNYWIIYFGLFVFMILLHSMVGLGKGDDVWFLEKSKMGILEFTRQRIEIWTSRNIIECIMLILLNMSKWVWIILDSAMFVLILHSMRKIIRVDEDSQLPLTIMLSCAIVLFPFKYFGSAGWYATTLNYVWPLAFGLYGLSYLIRVLDNEKINFIQNILVVLATLYATNQEQMCALFFGFLGCFIVYCLVYQRNIPLIIYIIFIIASSMLLYHMVCPGNAMRKLVETKTFFPEFANFSLVDKGVMGVVTTISIGLVNPAYVIFIWSIALFYIIYKNSNIMKQKILVFGLTFVNLIISLSDNLALNNIFNIFSKYIYKITCLNYHDIYLYLIILYFLIFIIVSLYIIKTNLGNRMFVFIGIILGAAFCSRVILGFSASVFESGVRTFINSYFLIIIASFLCFNFKKIDSML